MDSASSIPIVDFTDAAEVPESLSDKWIPSEKQHCLARKIIDAFSTIGFLCLVNTGISQSEIDALITETKAFFLLDKEKKMSFSRGIMSTVGWTAIARENLNPQLRRVGDYKETFNYQPFMNKAEIPYELECLNGWWSRCSKLTMKIMKLMGLGLGLENPSEIAERHQFGSRLNESTVRVNFYPKTAGIALEPGQVRCGEHSDYGSITLLCQDSPGLEVMNRSTWTYQQVQCVPGGIIVNIGDMMQRWTSDFLIANKHRVLIPDDPDLQRSDRVSIPFFAVPDQDTVIKCLVGKHKYEPVVMSDWLKNRIDEAFAERKLYSS